MTDFIGAPAPSLYERLLRRDRDRKFRRRRIVFAAALACVVFAIAGIACVGGT